MTMIRNLALSSMLVLLALPAVAEEQTIDLSVPGMFCASCPYVVQAAIYRLEGIRSVSADAESRTARVVYDDQVATVEAILAATKSAGYVSSIIAPKS